MIKNVIRNIYFKFNYFLLTILGFMLIFNRFNPINDWIAFPVLIGMLLAEVAIVVIVEFNEGPETVWIKFLKRFVSIDVLFSMILIILYVGACNNWFDIESR